ncbi:hypothetical protein M434DRAFT_312318 [Hypoxylon sp. CO27-5]|nr:hypothetical protein M434DRAFT_312318 [Hypoxylon sp. CO27-5]
MKMRIKNEAWRSWAEVLCTICVMLERFSSVPVPAIRFISKYPSYVLFPLPNPTYSHASLGFLSDCLLKPPPSNNNRKAVDNPSPLNCFTRCPLPKASCQAHSLRSSAAPPFSFWCVVKLPMSSTLITGQLIIDDLKPKRERFTTLLFFASKLAGTGSPGWLSPLVFLSEQAMHPMPEEGRRS